MKTLTLKKFDVLSVGYFFGILSAVVALVYTVVAVAATVVNVVRFDSLFPNVDFSVNWWSALWFVILYPLVAFVLGWLSGVVGAWFYNIALGASNGIKVDVDEK
jgi:hypothetical protein